MEIMEMVALEEVQGEWMNVGPLVADILEVLEEITPVQLEVVVPITQEQNRSILPGQIMDMVR